jgi:hypothetical protein
VRDAVSVSNTFGKIYSDLWDDRYGFCNVSQGAQQLYMYLIARRDRNKAGVVPLRIRKWTKIAPMLTDEQIMAQLDELASAGFVVYDTEEMELYLCDFIFRDEIYRQPNSVRTACRAIREVESEGIKAAIYTDLRAMEAEMISKGTTDSIQDYYDVLVYLDGYARPSRGVVRPFSTPTLLGSTTQAGGIPEHSRREHVSVVQAGTTAQDVRHETEDERRQSRPASPPRAEVVELCEHLADRIEGNGAKRPRVTQKWLDACRLMIDKDAHTAEQIRKAIDWCQDHEFWRSNILSMPTLREQYERLRLQAARPANGNGGRTSAPTVTSAEEMRV